MILPSLEYAHVVTASLGLPLASLNLRTVFCWFGLVASQMRTVESCADVIKMFFSVGCHSPWDTAETWPLQCCCCQEDEVDNWLTWYEPCQPGTYRLARTRNYNKRPLLALARTLIFYTYTSNPSLLNILGFADPVQTRNWSPVILYCKDWICNNNY